MATAKQLIDEFVSWADNEQGRQNLVSIITKSGGYPNSSTGETILNDHLGTIREHGIVIGSPRIRALMGFAQECKGAPIPPEEAIARLYAQPPWPALLEELTSSN